MDRRAESPGCKKQTVNGWRWRGSSQGPQLCGEAQYIRRKEGSHWDGGASKEWLFCPSLCLLFNWTFDHVNGDKYKSHRRKLKVCGMGDTTKGQSLRGDQVVGRWAKMRAEWQSKTLEGMRTAVLRQSLQAASIFKYTFLTMSPYLEAIIQSQCLFLKSVPPVPVPSIPRRKDPSRALCRWKDI